MRDHKSVSFSEMQPDERITCPMECSEVDEAMRNGAWETNSRFEAVCATYATAISNRLANNLPSRAIESPQELQGRKHHLVLEAHTAFGIVYGVREGTHSFRP